MRLLASRNLLFRSLVDANSFDYPVMKHASLWKMSAVEEHLGRQLYAAAWPFIVQTFQGKNLLIPRHSRSVERQAEKLLLSKGEILTTLKNFGYIIVKSPDCSII